MNPRGADHREPSHGEVLSAAMDWIEQAHDVTGRQGISAGYDLHKGWLPAYPETSGYSIPTLLRAAEALRRPELAVRAHEVAGWLQRIQLPDGSFPGGVGTGGAPVVFDVGQIMQGLLDLWHVTNSQSIMDSLGRAADWLRSVQDADGAWRSHAFLRYANTYSSRVTWSVARLWLVTGNQAHLECAQRSVDWMLSQVQPDGWIDRMAFDDDETPYTHTIAYTLRGLLRCGDILGGEIGERCVDAATRAALRLADIRTSLYPLLPGEIGPGFRPMADYACLTGDAQMVTVWLDIAHRHPELHDRAEITLRRLVATQVRQPVEPAVVGALPGSWPLTGRYQALGFPNWASKFLADAVLNTESERVRQPRATA
ncbi:MAG: beta-L-arabinofuranosidase domain-containing protein [Kibdelosporangium sp.]